MGTLFTGSPVVCVSFTTRGPFLLWVQRLAVWPLWAALAVKTAAARSCLDRLAAAAAGDLSVSRSPDRAGMPDVSPLTGYRTMRPASVFPTSH